MPDDAANTRGQELHRDETSRAAEERAVLPDSGFDKYVDRLRLMGDMRLPSAAQPGSGARASRGGSAFGSAFGGSAFGASTFGSSAAFDGSAPDRSGPLDFDSLWSTASELAPVLDPVAVRPVGEAVAPVDVEGDVEEGDVEHADGEEVEAPEPYFQPRTLRPALPPVRSARPPVPPLPHTQRPADSGRPQDGSGLSPVRPASLSTWSSTPPALSPALPPLPATFAASQPPEAAPPVSEPHTPASRLARLKANEDRAAELRGVEQQAAEQQAIRERTALEQAAQDQRAGQRWAAELKVAAERRAVEERASELKAANDLVEAGPPAEAEPSDAVADEGEAVELVLNGAARESVPAAVSLFAPMVQPLPPEPDEFLVGPTSVVDELFAALRERNSALLARLENSTADASPLVDEPRSTDEPSFTDESQSTDEPESIQERVQQPVRDPAQPDDPSSSLRPAQPVAGSVTSRRGLRGLLEVGTEIDPAFVPRPAPVTAPDAPPNPSNLLILEEAAADIIDLRAEPAEPAEPAESIDDRPPDVRDGWALDRRLTELWPQPQPQPLTELELRSQELMADAPSPFEHIPFVAAPPEPTPYGGIRDENASSNSVPSGSERYEPALVDLASVFPDPLDETKAPKRLGRPGVTRRLQPRRGNPAYQQRGRAGSTGTLRRFVVPGLTALVLASVAAAIAFVVINRMEDEPRSLRSGSPASSIAPEANTSATGAAGRAGPARFGVSGTSRAAVAAFGRWAGQDVDVVVDFAGRASWQEIADPESVLQEWAGSGHQLVLSTALLPEGKQTSIAAGAKGEYDRYYTALATNLVEAGEPDTVIRLGWEFNRGTSTWSTPSSGDFVAYWRRVVDAMRSVPGQDFRFDWNVNVGRTTYDATRYYPGPQYVDYVGVDVYDVSRAPNTYPYPAGCDAACRSSRQRAVWNRLYSGEGGLNSWSRFAQAKGKPMSVPGWGLEKRAGHGGQDDPYFVEQMHRFIADPENGVAYQAYFAAGRSGARHSLQADFPRSGQAFGALFRN